ncbi:MAG: lipocalin-like domain-containing protein [Hyphomonadaceae bacterium]
MPNLIGAWALVSSVNYRNDVPTPTFGNPPRGQLQYTPDGRMGAFLMDPAWAAKGESAAHGLTDFFAYAGTWRLDGKDGEGRDKVRHVIEFASIPARVGTQFVRTIVPHDENRIELVTDPEISKSGAVYVTRLVWRRHTPAAGANQA